MNLGVILSAGMIRQIIVAWDERGSGARRRATQLSPGLRPNSVNLSGRRVRTLRASFAVYARAREGALNNLAPGSARRILEHEILCGREGGRYRTKSEKSDDGL